MGGGCWRVGVGASCKSRKFMRRTSSSAVNDDVIPVSSRLLLDAPRPKCIIDRETLWLTSREVKKKT